MILTGASIRARGIITPHVPRSIFHGMSYGEGLAGYDIRLGRSVKLRMARTTLGVSLERFCLPNDVLGRVCDKSTWIRQGVRVGTTVIEPGWRGWLTLGLAWFPNEAQGRLPIGHRFEIAAGTPIAQVIFEMIEQPTAGYSGKYQDQPQGTVQAIFD